MKKYKKIITLLTAGSMVAALGACGGSGNAEGSSSSGDSKKGGKTELKMIFWDSNQEPGLKAMADGFMEKNPDIAVHCRNSTME